MTTQNSNKVLHAQVASTSAPTRDEFCHESAVDTDASAAYAKSAQIFSHNRRFIPGGVVSVNRAVQPEIVFVKGQGAHIWDADGNRYIDYHAAFAPHFLGHNDPYVTDAVMSVLRSRG